MLVIFIKIKLIVSGNTMKPLVIMFKYKQLHKLDVLQRKIWIMVFFQVFGRTHTYVLGGGALACLGFLVTSPLGFKARMGSALFAFCGGECNVCHFFSLKLITYINATQ